MRTTRYIVRTADNGTGLIKETGGVTESEDMKEGSEINNSEDTAERGVI